MSGKQGWSSRTAFVLAAIGSAAGLGNAWRFPYMAAENGGGAFLFPYFVAIITAGIPLLIAEFAIGHKMRAGAPVSFDSVKKGWGTIGWIAVLTSWMIVTYYGAIMAWVIDYLWYSLSTAWSSGSGDFFFGQVLQISDGPGQLGGFSMPALIGLVLAWAAVYWCIRDGVNTVSKVVKWTVPLPILMLGLLAIRSLTLPGAVDGINFYLEPNFSVLGDPKVWAAAYGQVFFSLSLAFGVMLAYASYLPKDSDVTNNAFMTAFANCGMSFLAGFAVFGTIGHMAFAKGAPVSEVAGTGGVGLAFVVYPEALSFLPFGVKIFSLAFFIMLFTLGIDSMFSLVEGCMAAVESDVKVSKKKLTQIFCVVGFVMSLLYVTKAGLYWLDIVDYYVNLVLILAVGFFEAIALGWIYKAKKIREHVNPISDFELGSWYDTMLKFVVPVVLGGILIWNFVQDIVDVSKGELYGGYPTWAIAVGGWFMVVGVVVVAFILGKSSIGNAKATEEIDS